MDRRRETFRPRRFRYLRSRSTSRYDLLRFAFLPVRFPELDATAFLHVVAGVHRKLADDVAGDNGLTAEAGLWREAPGGFETIRLVVLHLAEVLVAFPDDDVAGRAGAAAAAGVLERHVKVLREIEKRLGLAVIR